jgi:betaine lipid synthase
MWRCSRYTRNPDSSYVFLGCSRARDATSQAKSFEVEAGNKLGQGNGGLLTPASPFCVSPGGAGNIFDKSLSMSVIPDLNLGPAAETKHGYSQTLFEAGAPLSPFHYQLRKVRCVHVEKDSS